MYRPIVVLAILLLAQDIIAQPIWRLRNEDIQIRKLLLPRTPLPDSIKTYQVIPTIEAAPKRTSIDQNAVQFAFQLASLEKKANNPDVNIYVTIKDFKSLTGLKSHTDTTRQTWYWYEEDIDPQIEVALKDRNGKLLFSQHGGQSVTYKTQQKKSKEAALLDFNNRENDPVYLGNITEAYYKTLKAWSDKLKDKYDYQPETISLYRPNDSDENFKKNIKLSMEALQLLNQGRPQADALRAIQPGIDYFEKELQANGRKGKKAKQRYYASALNLINIYRCFDEYERARYYIRLLIEEEYLETVAFALHIAKMRERYMLHQYYKKTGNDLWDEQKKNTLSRLDSLKKQQDSEGYIVLKNDAIVKGTIVNIIENFNNVKVKLKYEKKLNAPVTDIEYSLTDIKEMHIENWHLAIIPYKGLLAGKKFLLAEIIYQSPKIAMYKTLPVVDVQKGILEDYRIYNPIEYLKKAGDHDYENIDIGLVSLFHHRLKKYLKDCPVVAKRVQYRYYAENQILDAIMDYDSICGNSKDSKVSNNEPSKVKHIKTRPSQSPGFYWGLSMGTSNFNGLFGINTTIRLKDQWFARTGAGLSFWGPVFAAGVKYDLRKDMRYGKGWSFAMGYAYIKGARKPLTIASEAETTVGNVTTVNNIEALVDTKSVGTINLSTIFNKFSGSKKMWHIEIGYAIGLKKQPWELVSANSNSKKLRSTMKIVQPGGPILGIGYNFGL